jgi:hypothetical protein
MKYMTIDFGEPPGDTKPSTIVFTFATLPKRARIDFRSDEPAGSLDANLIRAEQSLALNLRMGIKLLLVVSMLMLLGQTERVSKFVELAVVWIAATNRRRQVNALVQDHMANVIPLFAGVRGNRDYRVRSTVTRLLR